MKVGVCLPYMKRDYDRDTILAWCRAIDAGPWYSLSCGERITGPTCDMRVLLSAAAAVTTRVRIVPSLYVLPMHSAVWAAKEIATLDVLSGGRVTVTVGVGGREKDYQAVGASFRNRHERMDQQVAEMRRIWAGEPPFEGADPVGPTPVQAGGPPILIGAMGPKAMRRGAEWAQGTYLFSMNGDKAEIEKMEKMADEAWEQAKVAVKLLQNGTHKGVFEGIPPTDKKLTLPTLCFMVINNGKVSELWALEDYLGFYQQLGMELKPKEAKKK